MASQADIALEGPAEADGRRLPYVVGLLLGAALGWLTAVYSYMPVAGLVGLVAAGLIFWRPYIGFLLVVASLPLDSSGVISGDKSSLVLSISKILGVLTLAAAVFDVLIRQGRPALARMVTPETVLAVLFVLFAVGSGMLHPTKDSSVEILRLVTILVFVLTIVYFVDRPERVMHVCYVTMVIGALTAAHGLLQRLGGATNFSEEWVAEAGAVLDVGEEAVGQMLRSTSTFSHPSWLGLFLSLALPMTLLVIWTTRYRLVMAAGVIAGCLQVLGILTTYSRMSFVAAALGMMLFALRRRLGPGLLAGVVLVGVVAFPVLPEDLSKRVWSILEYQRSSSSLTRLGQQLAGMEMFRQNLLAGIGPGNYEARVFEYSRHIPERYPVEQIGAHNMYIETAAELGLPGLVLLVGLLAISWRTARRLRKQANARGDRLHAILWECLGVALIVFGVSAMFVHAQTRKEWWLLVALVAAGRSVYSRQESMPVAEAVRP